MDLTTVVLLHAAATLFMTGLIWFVQVVHYPLAASVGDAAFVDYQRQHMRRTTWVVAPVMLTEAATAAALVLMAGDAMRPLALIGVALLVLTWGSTAALQVPSHARLERFGQDPEEVRKLVRGNWVRTVCWTGRSAVAIGMVPVTGGLA